MQPMDAGSSLQGMSWSQAVPLATGQVLEGDSGVCLWQPALRPLGNDCVGPAERLRVVLLGSFAWHPLQEDTTA